MNISSIIKKYSGSFDGVDPLVREKENQEAKNDTLDRFFRSHGLGGYTKKDQGEPDICTERRIIYDLKEFTHSSFKNDDEPTGIREDGTKFWKNSKDQYHRDNDKPAVIYANGHKKWLVDGKLHRNNDKPAIVWADGSKEWWVDGQLHRENDQPATIWADGTKQWWVDGKCHRNNDQPAIIRADGSKEWWADDKRHREGDKPAIIRADGSKEWWVNNEFAQRKYS